MKYSIDREEKDIRLIAVDGLLIALGNSLTSYYNVLFATALGASDFEISLSIAIPQLMGVFVLIPGAILTDRMPNKRRMIEISLFMMAVSYLLMGFIPDFRTHRLGVFLTLLAVASCPLAVYNITWQAFFADVVTPQNSNRAITLRTRGTFLMNVIVPLATSFILSSLQRNEDKLRAYQWFYWVACLSLLVQVFSIRKVEGGKSAPSEDLRLSQILQVVRELLHNKKFLGFAAAALFFYMFWHIDFSLYNIGQIFYLKLNESWISYVNTGGFIVQFFSIGFWSRMNDRYGVRFTIIAGSLGLVFCPVAMLLGLSLPLPYGKTVFLIVHIMANLSIVTLSLDVLQCLLQVIDKKNKALCISIYTMMVMLSNAVMPVIGTAIYNAMGSTKDAMIRFNCVLVLIRIATTAVWTLRWRLLKNEPK